MPRTRRRTMKRRFRGGATAEEASDKRAQRAAELEKAVDDAHIELNSAQDEFDKAKKCERSKTSDACEREVGISYSGATEKLEKKLQITRNAIIEQEKFRLIEDVIKDEEFNNISNKKYIVEELNKFSYETIGDLISGITSLMYDSTDDETKQFENAIKNAIKNKSNSEEIEEILGIFKEKLKDTLNPTTREDKNIHNFAESMVNYIYKRVYKVYSGYKAYIGSKPAVGGKRSRTKRRSRVGGKRRKARRTKRRRRVGGRRQQQRRTQRRRTKSKRSKSTRRR